MSTNYNNNIDASYTNSLANNQSIIAYQENDLKCSHNPLTTAATINNNSNEKYVKFSKPLTSIKKSVQSPKSLKKWRNTPKDSVVNRMISTKFEEASSAEPTYYYYYYFNNNEFLQVLPKQGLTDDQLLQHQQQSYNNIVGGNYNCYYTIDGTSSDANYNEFFIQPIVNNENNSNQKIIKNWRRL